MNIGNKLWLKSHFSSFYLFKILFVVNTVTQFECPRVMASSKISPTDAIWEGEERVAKSKRTELREVILIQDFFRIRAE